MYIHNTFFTPVNWSHAAEPAGSVDRIPKTIHQVYFSKDGDTFLNKYLDAQRSWSKLTPDFKYKLWNKTMVDTFLETHYPEIYVLYMSYSSWMTRHDVSRYVIIYHFGGIYADIDTRCTGNISQLLSNVYKKKRQVVLHIGNVYLATTDFFAATAKHPFLLHVLSGLSEAKRWYIFPYFNIILSAGPAYLHGRYRHYQSKEQIMTLPDVNEYFFHFYASSWRKLDGKLVLWLEKTSSILIVLLGFTVGFIVLLMIYLRRKRRKASSQNDCIFLELPYDK